jgi:nitrate reductase NapE component
MSKVRAKRKRAELIEKCALTVTCVLGVTVAVLWAYGYGLMLAQGGAI